MYKIENMFISRDMNMLMSRDNEIENVSMSRDIYKNETVFTFRNTHETARAVRRISLKLIY